MIKMREKPMYAGQKVANTLREETMTEYLIQAQWAEMVELKRVINDLSTQLGRKLAVLDIGIGEARVPKRLSGIEEIWDLIAEYYGIDNSEEVLEKAQLTIIESGLENKVRLYNLDAKNLGQLNKEYDLALCTYFTSGNFYPNGFSFETGEDGKLKNSPDLEQNDSFQRVFQSAYNLLSQGGQLVLGSTYIDNDATRKKQEEFYEKSGMTVITRPEDSFTATKEGFWSQRFTGQRLRRYFNWVKPDNIEFRPLDTYGLGQMVIVFRR